MKIRKTCTTDIDVLLKIFDQAKHLMQTTGNANQWINGYPSREVIENDVAGGNSYVCIDDDEEIVGTFFFSMNIEPTYEMITDGQWLNDKPYGTLHRLAGSGKVKGIGTYCLEWCFSQHPNVRVDTHRDNRIMQSILKKNGYRECGIIHLASGAPRLAFQKCEL